MRSITVSDQYIPLWINLVNAKQDDFSFEVLFTESAALLLRMKSATSFPSISFIYGINFKSV